MYTVKDYQNKMDLKADILAGKEISIYQPGPFGPAGHAITGEVSLEGPHYPKPHKWYAHVHVTEGVIDKMIS